MRTTLNVDDDLLSALRSEAERRGVPLRQVVNEALRSGLGESAASEEYRLSPVRMGVRPGLDLDRARHLAAALDDASTLEKFTSGR